MLICAYSTLRWQQGDGGGISKQAGASASRGDTARCELAGIANDLVTLKLGRLARPCHEKRQYRTFPVSRFLHAFAARS